MSVWVLKPPLQSDKNADTAGDWINKEAKERFGECFSRLRPDTG